QQVEQLMNRWTVRSGAVFVALATSAVTLHAQDRLKTYPGYQAYQEYQTALRGVAPGVQAGSLVSRWVDSSHIEFLKAGKRYSYDVRTLTATEIPLQSANSGQR